MENSSFKTSNLTTVSISEIASSIKKFIEEEDTSSYKLTIGTDSETKQNGHGKILELITAIVIYRKGFGGRYFWSRKHIKNVKSLRDKIYQEVNLSIETAHLLVPELRSRLNDKSTMYDLEIHIDVGERGDTREMIKEVVGIVSGNGFVAKTKPYSYAASNIADRHV